MSEEKTNIEILLERLRAAVLRGESWLYLIEIIDKILDEVIEKRKKKQGVTE